LNSETTATWYCEHRCFQRSYSWWDYGGATHYASSPYRKLAEKEIEAEISRLGGARFCKLCGEELKCSPEEEITDERDTRDHVIREIYGCRGCGWWRGEHETGVTRTDGRKDEGHYTRNYAEGLLRVFKLSDHDLPLEALRVHLRSHPDSLVQVSPSKFEELAQAAYREHFHCEVRRVGGPGDNGVDLYAVVAQTPHLIQVKRRSSSGAIEGVQGVRELIGTVVLHGAQNGHLVTSAERFSNAAVATASASTLKEARIQITLVARDMLFSMLRLERGNLWDRWNGELW
jgi:hypothetical protein